MDIETLIPIIIIAIAYLYKTFENARKKEDKPGQPASKPLPKPQRPSEPTPKPLARKAPEQARSQPAEKEWWDQEVSEPSHETAYTEPAAPKMQWDRLKTEKMSGETISASDLINPEEMPEEVIRFRKMRRLSEKAPVPIYQEPEAENEYADFDLQDAVIKSVILERREF